MIRRFFPPKDMPIVSGSVDFIIAGLGNPGKKYEMTRHNAGFLALDAIAEKYSASVSRIKFKGLCTTVVMGSRKVLLLKPSTFMNLSGQSVTEAMSFYKLPPEKVLILFDDISLDPGKIRIRRKGSDGGQNGMKNIICLSGSDSFPRIKIGTGDRPNPEYDLADWVLSRFSEKELPLIRDAISHAVSASELIADGKIDEAMNTYNA